jgi:peptidoglycan pentaglycine glycine transferase (the first glycine)
VVTGDAVPRQVLDRHAERQPDPTLRPSEAAASEWDDFLARTPGGSHRQSSRWAAVKQLQGWEARRLVERRDGHIVAGAQLLIKPLPGLSFLGKIGYCSKGPLLGEHDPELAAHMLGRIHRFCRREHVQVLIVQPPEDRPSFDDLLVRAGYVASPVPVAPRATVLVDIAPELDVIEQRLGKNLRKQLRRAERRGMGVRRGGSADIPTFYALLTAASERLDYPIFPAGYYQRLWDVFSANGNAQLFLAEYEGHAVSAGLCLVFGDRVVPTALAWSGEHGDLNPNDLVLWHMLQWAKSRGLQCLELENLSYDLAVALVAGVDPAALRPKGSDAFKLKWSTDVVLVPMPYLHLAHPVAGFSLRCVPERVFGPALQTLATRLRPTTEG